MQSERALSLATINPNVFLISFGRSRQFKQALRRRGQDQADLFTQFPHRAGVISFTRVEMAGSRRIPKTRLAVFAHRAFLQEDLAAAVKHEYMDRAMHETEPVNLAARLAIDDLIPLVNDVKNRLTHAISSLAAQIVRARHLPRGLGWTVPRRRTRSRY